MKRDEDHLFPKQSIKVNPKNFVLENLNEQTQKRGGRREVFDLVGE